MPDAKKKKGFGDFLRSFAGFYGDALTGHPVYAQHLKDQTEADQSARSEQAQKDWWYEQQRYQEGHRKPDTPGIADEFNWYQGQTPEVQQGVQQYMKMRYPGQYTPPAPITQPYGSTIEGTGSKSPAPGTIEDGYRFKGGDPGDPNNWERAGGASPSSGSGGFPRY